MPTRRRQGKNFRMEVNFILKDTKFSGRTRTRCLSYMFKPYVKEMQVVK